MKRLLTLLALVLCSCAETFVGEEIARPNNESLPDLEAAFADKEATRTYIEEGKYLRWNEDDRLTIFYGNTLNRQYKFNGATGDNSGTFSLVPDGMLGTDNAFDHIYALYPYNADARISDEGVISLTLPAVQNYAENSFGRGANTMIAVTENLEDTFLAFKNACGYLKLKLYNAEGATIKNIEVKGNSGERLAGAATATIAFGEAPVLAMADDATTSVTLDCGEGVALGTTAETATEFWVTLPVTTFAEGFTITATDTEGGVFEKSTTNEVIIERNAIQPMAALEAECTPPGPADNEIWYTNGSTTEATTPYNTNLFGANIVSNTYDTVKECWIIKFDGNVTMIGEWTFAYCSSLTSVTIPDSVNTIGSYAFFECLSLTSVTIPDSVTSIGYDAFESCWSLTSVTIPDSVTSIGYHAFAHCTSLTSVTIPDSVTTIGNGAFYDCSKLTSVTISDSVTTIGEWTFANCLSLTNVTIPDSVTTIGNYAFESCISLTSVTIPDSVTTIGKSAFGYCSSLTSVYCKATTPPAGGSSMFSFNASGRKIYVPTESVEAYKSASYWSSYASDIVGYNFENGVAGAPKPANYEIWYTNGSTTEATTPYETNVFGANIVSNTYDAVKECWIIKFDGDVTMIGDDAFRNCSSHTSVTIPDSVTTIGNYAFCYCRSLTSVTIGNSVTIIGNYAFYDCSSLTSVTIGDSVTTIGYNAFQYCSSLTSVTIPDSVTTIGEAAFNWCERLTSVYCKPTTPPAGSSYVFGGNASGRKIYVPMESVEAYKSASGWNEYADDIVGYDFENGVVVPNTPPNNEIWYTSTDGNAVEPILTHTIGSAVIESFKENIISNNYQDGKGVIVFEDDVTEVGYAAFNGCSKLLTINLSTTVETIGNYTFYNCTNLSQITLSNNITYIGGYAFCGCSNLCEVYCESAIPPTGNNNMFDGNASNRKIYVPMESVEAYKSAEYWKNYADAIVGYDF